MNGFSIEAANRLECAPPTGGDVPGPANRGADNLNVGADRTNLNRFS